MVISSSWFPITICHFTLGKKCYETPSLSLKPQVGNFTCVTQTSIHRSIMNTGMSYSAITDWYRQYCYIIVLYCMSYWLRQVSCCGYTVRLLCPWVIMWYLVHNTSDTIIYCSLCHWLIGYTTNKVCTLVLNHYKHISIVITSRWEWQWDLWESNITLYLTRSNAVTI